MIESDEDRLLFLDEGEFGQVVTLAIEGQAPREISAIFDTRPPFAAPEFKGFRPTASFGEDHGKASGASPRLTCRSSDVIGAKSGRATVVVGGLTYNVFDVIPDATGWSIVSIKRVL